MYTNPTTSTTNAYANRPLNNRPRHRPLKPRKEPVLVYDDPDSLEPIDSWSLDDFSDFLPSSY